MPIRPTLRTSPVSVSVTSCSAGVTSISTASPPRSIDSTSGLPTLFSTVATRASHERSGSPSMPVIRSPTSSPASAAGLPATMAPTRGCHRGTIAWAIRARRSASAPGTSTAIGSPVESSSRNRSERGSSTPSMMSFHDSTGRPLILSTVAPNGMAARAPAPCGRVSASTREMAVVGSTA